MSVKELLSSNLIYFKTLFEIPSWPELFLFSRLSIAFTISSCVTHALFVLSDSPAPVIITPGLEQEDGWIIIQRRMNAFVSFERSWDEYATSFGDVDGNFWLGLEAMHDLTTAQPMKLQIDVVPFDIPAVSIPYQQFHVGDAASDYRLTVNSGTPGYDTLYNSMNYHSGMRFSTYDNDNDDWPYNCAESYRAGWWFGSCGTYVLLNSVHGGACGLTDSNMRMFYLGNNNYEPIRTVTMKIRPIN